MQIADPSRPLLSDWPTLWGRQRATELGWHASYGLAYAFRSLGCTLPLVLAVGGTGLARAGPVGGLEQLVLYGFGLGVVVSALTVLVAVLARGVLRGVRGVGRILEPLGALLLLATAGYIVYYWLSGGGAWSLA